MDKGSEDRGESLAVVDRPGLHDLFIYRINVDHGYLVGFLELPEEHVSLYPVVDFIVDEEILGYVSFMEKIVLDEFYRVPPMTFAVIGFYNSYGDEYVVPRLGKFLKDGFRVWTVQWFSWDVKPVSTGYSSWFNYVLSFSRFLPSRYRPEVINGKVNLITNNIKFFNYTCFNGWVDVGKLASHFDGLADSSVVIFPPNLLDLPTYSDGELVYKALFLHFDSFQDMLDTSSALEACAGRVLNVYSDFFHSLVSRGDNIYIFPFFVSSNGGLNIVYLIFSEGKWSVVYGPVYEGEDFVLDPFGVYKGRKLKVFFGLWGRVRHRKGWSLIDYLNFDGYKTILSRMFFELRYGGKIIYSGPSKVGVLSLPENV